MNCKERNCNKEATAARGWCSSHYYRWWRYGDPQSGGRQQIRNNDLERFNSYILIDEATGCHLWQGQLDHNGRAKFRLTSRWVFAARWIFTVNRDLPVGQDVGNTCHDRAALAGECGGGVECIHRRCVNIDHLGAQTRAENNMFKADRLERRVFKRVHS